MRYFVISWFQDEMAWMFRHCLGTGNSMVSNPWQANNHFHAKTPMYTMFYKDQNK